MTRNPSLAVRIVVLAGMAIAATVLPGPCLAFQGVAGSSAPAEQARPDEAMSGQAVLDLPDPSRFERLWALSDVHGMAGEVRRLLRAAGLVDARGDWSGGKALLLVVGDTLDKGPDSVGVLDLWRRLASQAPEAGGAVVHLLGNHEAEFLADPGREKSRLLREECDRKGLSLAELTSAATPRGSYLRAMPLAARIGRWLFCHAGWYPDLAWSDFRRGTAEVLAAGDYSHPWLIASGSILMAKDWWRLASGRATLLDRLSRHGFEGVVQGHQPAAFGIRGRIGTVEGGRLVKLDTGMAPSAGSHAGELLMIPAPARLAERGVPEMRVLEPSGAWRILRPEPVRDL